MRKIKNKGFLVTAILLGALSWSLLPDTVITQVDVDGNPTTTMSKLIAILISLALTVTGTVMDNRKSDKQDRRGIIIAIGGIAIMVVMLVTNLFIYK